MPGTYARSIHLSDQSEDLAQELAHQLCQATISSIREHFTEADGYRTRIDGQPNGDLRAEVARGALHGTISSVTGKDVIYGPDGPQSKRLVRFNAEYQNAEAEAAEKYRQDILYYIKAFTLVFGGTFLALVVNVIVGLTIGLVFWFMGIFTVISYSIAGGIGVFFGERLGDIVVAFQNRKTEGDTLFHDSTAAWDRFTEALSADVEELCAASLATEQGGADD